MQMRRSVARLGAAVTVLVGLGVGAAARAQEPAPPAALRVGVADLTEVEVRLGGPAGPVAVHVAPNLPDAPDPVADRAAGYAAVDRPGPALQVPRRLLDASRHCQGRLAGATTDPVLLIPGTTVDPPEAFSWNWAKALAAQGIPFCDVTLPNHTDDDIQVAAEYVVDAVRSMSAASGRRVILLGWSQGASTLPRWALRWWPDLRPLVSSQIGLAPLHNIGSVVANGPCLLGSCVPAAWQQSVGSEFMRALNSGAQTFPEIAYTAIYSRTDEVVTPDVDGALSTLPPGPNVLNVALQDVCALDLSEHLTIIASPTAYAIAMDAIRHPGRPADLSRVTVTQPCLPGTMPYVDPVDLLTWEATIGLNVGPRLFTGAVDREPPLACYVKQTCR